VGTAIGQPDRIAVGLGARDRLGPDIAAAAYAVLDEQLLAQALAKLLRQEAGDNVGAAPRRERHDQADRPFRPACLRARRLGSRGSRKRAADEQCQR
jgi:hypothetical protein